MTKRRIVKLGTRTFVVMLDDADNPINIRERKKIVRHGVEQVFDYSYWHAKNHKLGGPNSMSATIIREARSK